MKHGSGVSAYGYTLACSLNATAAVPTVLFSILISSRTSRTHAHTFTHMRHILEVIGWSRKV